MASISQLHEKKNDLISKATAELQRSGPNSAEYKSLLKETEEVSTRLAGLQHIERSLPAPVAPAPAPVVIANVGTVVSSEQRRAQINAAARHFLRHGLQPQAPEQRALLTSSDANGEALVSQDFDSIFTEAAKYFGPVWNLVNRKDASTGAPTKFVVSDDTARTFSLLTEGTTSGSGVASQPTVFSNVNSTDTLISSVIYSVEELEDAFDLEAFLTKQAGVGVSRAWEHAITLGTTNDGTSTALPNGAGGLLSSISAGVTQTSGTLAAGPTYAQLSALAGSVNRAYYQTGSFMASPSVETFLRSQVDTTGRALYPIDPNTGLLVIAGRLLYPNASMVANLTASSPIVTFGDYSKQWNVLNAGLRIKVIGNNDESPALSFLTREMLIWTRIGQSAGLSSAVKSLVSAAS